MNEYERGFQLSRTVFASVVPAECGFSFFQHRSSRAAAREHDDDAKKHHRVRWQADAHDWKAAGLLGAETKSLWICFYDHLRSVLG
jgi:hypothetical protein